MTDDPTSRAKARLDLAMMSAERPLDALLPSLKEPALPDAPVHSRVLERETEEGLEWVLIVRRDPGGPRALHESVQALVEATLLAELSRTPASLAKTGARRCAGLRLVVMPAFDWDVAPAVRAFGFTLDENPPAADVLRAVGAELERLGDPPALPDATWSARIQHPSGTLGEHLAALHADLATALGDVTWGTTPGEFSHRFATHARRFFAEPIRPDADGLHTMDLLLVQREEGVIRWIPPLAFQALCDFLPVVAAAVHGARISWAVSEDLGDGFAHPPLVRVDDGGEGIHIPIGHHVLRWWMMPLAPGEEVPSLEAWLDDQFASD